MAETAEQTDGWEWAAVEIMGFRKHAGRIREEERFGAKMLRVDIPVNGDPAANGWETHWYGGSSIFSLTLTDEASVMRANKPYEPPARVRLSPPAPEIEVRAGEEQYDDDDGAFGSDDDVERVSEAERVRAIADRAEARAKASGSEAT